MNIPEEIRYCECWARDGIQGEPQFIPTQKKIEIINRMIEIGFKRIEITSFSNPKLIPQFSDSLEVLRNVDRADDVMFIAIVPNDKALNRLFDISNEGYGVHEITAIISASEDHLLANLEMTFKQVKPQLASLVKRAKREGLGVIGCIGTSFGCPLMGDVPVENVIELTDWYLQQGATKIMLGDTTGEANPLQVRNVYSKMKSRYPGVDFIAHFHDTRGMGLANTYAALQEGIIYHDGSFGGIGGQPATRRPKYHKGFSGNTCTEDLISMLSEMGITTGVQLDNVLELANSIEDVCGRELRGQVTRSGPVRHRYKFNMSTSVLKIGQEISPAIFNCDQECIEKLQNPEQLASELIFKCLEKNWRIDGGVEIDLSGVKIDDIPKSEAVLVTRLKVSEITGNKVSFGVLSQKSNGDVYMEGDINMTFKSM